jgi:preprotein translocase subunit SecF
MLDLVGKRNWFFLASLLLLVPGVISLLIPPRLKPGIEFTSGTTFSFRYAEQVSSEDVRDDLESLGYDDARVQGTGDNQFLVQTKEIEGSASAPPVGPALPSERERIEAALGELHGGFVDTQDNPTTQFIEFSSVSAAVSREIGRNAAIAVVAASVMIAGYIAYSFRNVPNSLRYGASAIVALLHDVLLVIGVFSILGKFFDTEVNTFFITGLLTVVGFSVHDSIVVFDRIRENVARGQIPSFSAAVNHSLLQTMGRSFNTSLTLVFSILALLLLGGERREYPRLPHRPARGHRDRNVQLGVHRQHVPGVVARGRLLAAVAAGDGARRCIAGIGGSRRRVTARLSQDRGVVQEALVADATRDAIAIHLLEQRLRVLAAGAEEVARLRERDGPALIDVCAHGLGQAGVGAGFEHDAAAGVHDSVRIGEERPQFGIDRRRAIAGLSGDGGAQMNQVCGDLILLFGRGAAIE